MGALACLALLPILPVITPAARWPAENQAGGAPPAVVLVLSLPRQGPPELRLPGASQVADTILLQFPSGQVSTVVEQPVGLADGEEFAATVRKRSRQLQAGMALWFTVASPAPDCAAPRRLRLSLLDVASGEVSERLLCPAGAGAADIAQAVALAAAGALRRLIVTGRRDAGKGGLERLLPRRDSRTARARSRCPPCPRRQCPPRQAAHDTSCPPCPAPVLPVQKPGRFRLAAGFVATSHPRPSAAGYGVGVEFSLRLLNWLEVGLDVAATASRRLDAVEVRALYQDWPLALWLRGCFGSGRIEGLVDAGVTIDLVNLDALLERFSESITVSRIDPALRLRAGMRWWMTRRVGLELLAGTSVYLRTQRITYLYLGLPVEVLNMERLSFDGSLALVVAFE
ncbi:MAG: hypothetical protein DRI34_14490 [Deltaproteobacteria bacterium]|nr:MAG: hypothetical protein DRI34_14490 [Deltaproteobacteria bacterium]